MLHACWNYYMHVTCLLKLSHACYMHAEIIKCMLHACWNYHMHVTWLLKSLNACCMHAEIITCMLHDCWNYYMHVACMLKLSHACYMTAEIITCMLHACWNYHMHVTWLLKLLHACCMHVGIITCISHARTWSLHACFDKQACNHLKHACNIHNIFSRGGTKVLKLWTLTIVRVKHHMTSLELWHADIYGNTQSSMPSAFRKPFSQLIIWTYIVF